MNPQLALDMFDEKLWDGHFQRAWDEYYSAVQEMDQDQINRFNHLILKTLVGLIKEYPEDYELRYIDPHYGDSPAAFETHPFADAPDWVKEHESLEDAAIEGWAEKIRQHPIIDQVPDWVKNNADILQAQKDGWMRVLKDNPSAYQYLDFPERLKKDPDILKYIGKSREIRRLLKNPQDFENFKDYFSRRMKDDKSIQKARKRGWDKRIQKGENPTLPDDLGDESDLALQQIFAEF